MRVTYLDSSAIVKLVLAEPESAALRQYLRRRRPLVSSALARTEVFRSVLPTGDRAVARSRVVFRALELIRVSNRVLDAAGVLAPFDIRSLDAIHLATAQLLGHELSHVVTYDQRMAEAAKQLGLRTSAPV